MTSAELNFRALLRHSLLLGLLYMVTACALLPEGSEDPAPSSLDLLLAENNFVAANNWLERETVVGQVEIDKIQARQQKAIDSGNLEKQQSLDAKLLESRRALAEKQQLLASLAPRSDKHVRSRLQEIESIARSGDWREANKQLEKLEALSLSSDRLSGYRERFDSDRSAKLASLEHQLLMLESRQLPEREMLYRALAKTGYGEASLYARLRSEQDLKNRVESSLRERAMNAERQGRVSVALQYLTALARLDESDAVKADVRRVSNWLSSTQKAQPKKSGDVSQNKPDAYQLGYGAAVAEKDWVEARRLLDEALSTSPSNAELKAQDAFLSDQYSKIVEASKQEAEKKYTSGKIEEALIIWQNATQYAPEDVTLLTNIQRASKILEKLDQLQRAAENDGR